MSAYKVSEKLHYTLIGVAMCGIILSLFGGRSGFGFGAFFITACGFWEFILEHREDGLRGNFVRYFLHRSLPGD